MEPILFIAFGLAVAAGAADALGGSIFLARKIGRRELTGLIALSAGFILAITLLERLPAAEAALPEYGLLLVLAGYLVLFAAENAFAHGAHEHPHHHHDEDTHTVDALVGPIHPEKPLISPAAGMAAYAGLSIHAFFDGAAIVAGFLVDVKLGVLLFIAVMLHKVPEGLSMASITMASGHGRAAAFRRAVVLGGTTALGGLVAAVAGSFSGAGVEVFLALATGSFLYVAASDLIPAANAGRGRTTLLFVLGGAGLFFLSEWLLETAGFSL